MVIAFPATIATKYVLDFTTSITKLLQQNGELRTAIGNLTKEQQIGYAKVIEQEEENGKLYTTPLFVETDRGDKSKVVLKKNYKIEGDIIHSAALVVKFSSDLVMTGKEKALYLWRRVDGEYVPAAARRTRVFPLRSRAWNPDATKTCLKDSP